MRLRPGAARKFFLTTILLVVAHFTLLLVNPNATAPSNLLVLSMIVWATLLCGYAAYVEGPETRALWLLLGAGLALASIGQMEWTYTSYFQDVHSQKQAFNFDFFYYVYAVPILLAICSREHQSRQSF